MFRAKIHSYFIVLFVEIWAYDLDPRFTSQLRRDCPSIVPTVYESSIPAGKLGDNVTLKYERVKNVDTFKACIEACCRDSLCNDVFIFNKTNNFNCFKASCTKDEKCLPFKKHESKYVNSAFVILVRPREHATWQELLLPSINVTSSTEVIPTSSSSSSTASIKHLPRGCEVGLDLEECYENEVCVPLRKKNRNGLCRCKDGFHYDDRGRCVTSSSEIKITTTSTTSSTTATTSISTLKKITVQIASKNITLPENSAKLSAYAIPSPAPGEKYEYEWKLISNQTSGIMEKSHTPVLTLSNLAEGVYCFQVVVKSKKAYGEAFGNVTVFPPKRFNKAPKALVQPESQNITLPTKKAVIDGSGSTDDATSALRFKWEVTSGPIGYQPKLPSEPTLTLDNLILGNYIVTLTVTDEEGLSDSTTAKITVVPEKDYPPTANAGEDIFVYLPQNEVTLNGNRSTDDHGIVSWEWTRPPSKSELAADTQFVRTPFPKISNLVKGIYTFTLKVTDVKGQTSEDQVNVFVRDPISLPPNAEAGNDQEISLPQTWIVLDGKDSKDDVNITSWNWKQLSGPKPSIIKNKNSSVANATELTKGTYIFELTVMDNLQNENSDNVTITVNQDTNSAPIADAGPDMTVTLPVSRILIDGSKSKDDLRISKWEWTRDSNSLAAGKILGNSSHEPVLILIDAIPGQYIFRLQVWDDQGKSSSDSVSINVHENPNQLDVIQAILNENMNTLTQSRLESILQKIALLLPQSDGQVNVELADLFPQIDSNFAVLQFLVRTTTSEGRTAVIKGVEVVDVLKTKLEADSDLLELKVLQLDTVICQNKCSNHGSCHQATRTCICEPFWIENFVRRHLMDGRSNCDWSIIYVGIFLGTIMSAVVCGLTIVMCKKKKIRIKPPRSRRQYTRLDQRDEHIEMKNSFTSSLMDSETDSDDDILFENMTNGTVIPNGGSVIKRSSLHS